MRYNDFVKGRDLVSVIVFVGITFVCIVLVRIVFV